MIKKIILTILPFMLIVGTFMFALHIFELQGITILTAKSIQYTPGYTWTYYEFNLAKYLQNLETSININQLSTIMPDLPVLPARPSNSADVVGYLNFIAKIITVYVLNWLIYIVNLTLLVPTKLILYPLNIILAILGINTSNNEFIATFRQIYNTTIPMVVYW